MEKARSADGAERERDSLRMDLEAQKKDNAGLDRDSQTLQGRFDALEEKAAGLEQNLQNTQGQLDELRVTAKSDASTIKHLNGKNSQLRSLFAQVANFIDPSPYRSAENPMSDKEIDKFMLDQIGKNARRVLHGNRKVGSLAETLKGVPAELRGESDLETVENLMHEVSFLTRIKTAAMEVYDRVAAMPMLKLPAFAPLREPLRKLGKALGRKLPFEPDKKDVDSDMDMS